MTNSLLKQMLRSRRKHQRIQALLLCLAMLVSLLTMVSLKYNGVAVTIDDAEPVLGESAVSEMTGKNDPAPVEIAEDTETNQLLPEEPEEPEADGAENDAVPSNLASETADAVAAETAVTAEAAPEGEQAETENERSMPSAMFEGVIGDLSVRADAPEGAFPAGTSMKLSPVEDKSALDSIRDAVDEQIVRVCAVDISFRDADGSEIEPLLPIRVEILPAAEAKDTGRTVVHLDNEGEASVVEQEENGPQENGAVQFMADSFSVYAVVFTVIEKTVLASDGHNYRISVTCGDKAGVPADAKLSVEELPEGSPEYREYAARAENAMGWAEGSASYLRLFDIKIVDAEGAKVEITAPVDVKIVLADKSSDTDTVVLHFADGEEQPDLVRNVGVTGDTLSFEASGFSIYAVVDEGENARIGYRFWYNDGTQNVLLSTQYFRYKDVHPSSGDGMQLYQPSIPGMEAATWNRIFNGWSRSAALTEPLYILDELNDELNGRSSSEYDETVIDLYANLTNVYYVTYVDVNPNNVLSTEIVPKEDEGDTTFTIKTRGELLPTIDSDTELNGWYELGNMSTVYEPGQENVVIDSDMTLYPAIEGGHWLVFNDNDPVWDPEKEQYVSGGASFTPPAFYLDEATVEPDAPTWNGYTFGGWYTTPDCNDGEEFTFGGTLSHSTTVYAKWIPAASQYRVIIWKQRTSDGVDLTDDSKTYDYVTSYLIDENVYTGQSIPLDDAYKNIYGSSGTSSDTDKAYFIYNDNRTDQTVVVKADGSSVLNVYYDRKPVTLNFHIWDYSYTPTTQNSGTCYGLVDGEYVELTRSGNTWTYVAGTEYTYTRYTGTREGYYYIPDGNGGYTYVYLYRNNNRWYRTRTGSWWSGYTYSNEYTGEIYNRSETDVIETYTGTRYRRSEPHNWRLYKSLSGLYGSTFAQNGYTWPAEYWWYDKGGSNGGIDGTRTTVMTAFLPTVVDTSGNTVTEDFYGSTSSGSVRINFHVQELDGSYTLREYVTTSVGYNGNSFYITDKYIGYHASQYRVNNSGAWQSAGTPNSSGYYNNGVGVPYRSQLDIRFDLNNHTLSFYTNNGSNQLIDYTLPYSKSLAEYAGQSEGQRNGYFFLGWYADPSCTEPFDFTQTMPDNNIAVYGKWKIIRTRVVIVPGAENVHMGSQARTFRLDYDERIDGGLLETATRAGYILDGWYTDPEFTNRFLFSNPVNSQTTGVDTTYGTSDRWAAARAAYGDDSENYDNVRNILHLYAKWILDPDTSGYNVVYDAGDAALVDDLGNLLTTVPIDTRMYAFGEGATPSTREAPSNYNDLYSFAYWEATREDGTTLQLYPGDPIPLSELQASETITDELTGEVFRKTITLRAVYTTDAGDRLTHITYDGDTFTESVYPSGSKEVQGKTKDGTERVTVTLDKEVNQTITLPDEDEFYLDGYELVGWSFFEGSYDEQIALENAFNAEHPDNTVTHFEPGAQVAADNLIQNDVNDEHNTLYAMWQPKTYTVTVRQVIESGVPVSTFTYVYRTGAENELDSAPDQLKALTGNTSFTVDAPDGLDGFIYYDISGHVVHITTPEIPAGAPYDVRVHAVVTRDDGTTEILNPTALGNYPILGDVVIIYTYSLKAEVRLQKRDATAHETVLTGAVFVMTPVEYNTASGRWENAGDGNSVTINSATEILYLQEGTYRITETAPPADYAAISSELYLTVTNEGAFSLFDAAGNAIDAQIAELDSASSRILTVYDNPIRTVTLSKAVEGESEDSFSFKLTAYNNDGSRLGNYVIGTMNGADLTTNNIGEVTISLHHGDAVELRVPHGSKLTVEETEDSRYEASYVWNGGAAVESRIFGTEPVAITEDSTLAYTNSIAAAPVTLKKVGINNMAAAPTEYPLTGATFTIYEEDKTTIVAAGVTSEGTDAVFYSGMLKYGTYYLKETSVPNGYNAPMGMFKLTVSDTAEATMIQGDWTAGSPDNIQGTVTGNAQDGYVITVRNTTGYTLPSTGGSGIRGFRLLGGLMILLSASAGGMSLRRRRREEKI